MGFPGPYIEFLLWAYLNTDKPGQGLDLLHTDTDLFQAFQAIAKEEILSKQLVSNKSLSSEQNEFVYDCFIPCVQALVEFHFPTDTTSQLCLYEMAVSIATFFNLVLPDPNGNNTATGKSQKNKTAINQFRAGYCVQLFRGLEQKLFMFNKPDQLIVVESGPKKILIEAMQRLMSIANSFGAGIVSNAAIKGYNTRYRYELQVNEKFNNFVRNLEKMYKSENTVGHQLDLASTLSEDERKKSYCDGPGGDLELPLGPEFQHFVNLFADFDHSSVKIEDHMKTVARLFEAYGEQSRTKISPERLLGRVRVTAKILAVIRAIAHNVECLDFGKEQMLAFQDAIADTGAIPGIAHFMASPAEHVRRHALGALYITIEGGNKNAQRTIQAYFLGSRKERFFEDVANIIQQDRESIVSVRALRTQKAVADEKTKKIQMAMRGSLAKRLKVASDMADRFGGEDDDLVAVPQPMEEEGSLVMKGHGSLQLLLLVLQAMCEGNNTMMQNYFRIQPDNINSKDIVKEVALLLGHLITEMTPELMPLIIQCCITITEFVQGNAENQLDISQSRILPMINDIIRSNSEVPMKDRNARFAAAEKLKQSSKNGTGKNQLKKITSKSKLNELYASETESIVALDVAVVDILHRMLATNDQQTSSFAAECDRQLDITCILRMMRTYSLLNECCPDDDAASPSWAEIGFRYFNVVCRLE